MKKSEKPIPWLPVDSRLFGSFISFGHVHGAVRVFLELEIILSVSVVVGTLMAVVVKLLQ